MTLWIGIDPGASGALAFQDEAGFLDILDMPTVKIQVGKTQRNRVSPSLLVAEMRRIIGRQKARAMIEEVWGMIGDTPISAFSFGRAAGAVETACVALDIPIEWVYPQTWQSKCRARGGKDSSRARAAELYPHYAHFFTRKSDDGRADATLVSHYAVNFYGR